MKVYILLLIFSFSLNSIIILYTIEISYMVHPPLHPHFGTFQVIQLFWKFVLLHYPLDSIFSCKCSYWTDKIEPSWIYICSIAANDLWCPNSFKSVCLFRLHVNSELAWLVSSEVHCCSPEVKHIYKAYLYFWLGRSSAPAPFSLQNSSPRRVLKNVFLQYLWIMIIN